MFNLLVSGSGWSEARDTIRAERAFEYTEQHLLERCKPDGQIDFSALITLPALFLEESSAQGDEVARVRDDHACPRVGPRHRAGLFV